MHTKTISLSLSLSLSSQSSPAVPSGSATPTPPPPSSSDGHSLTISPVTIGRAAARKARDRLHTLITQLRPPEETVETESPDAVANGDASSEKKSSKSPSPSGTGKMWKSRKSNWAEAAVTPEEMKALRKKFNGLEGSMICPIQVLIRYTYVSWK